MFFWHQSEARTAATVWNWSVRHCPQGLFSSFFTFLRAIFLRPFRLSLARIICPWVSEDGPGCDECNSKQPKKWFCKFAHNSYLGQKLKLVAWSINDKFVFQNKPKVEVMLALHFREILSFHCHAIKIKNSNQSIRKVQNLGNERKKIYKKLRQESGLCEILGKTFHLNFYGFLRRRHIGAFFRAQVWPPETNTGTSVFGFSYLIMREFIAWGTYKG